ncbi:MAG: hypothetical protein ABSB23_10465 [Bryobacteraceae bacterium]|jgi:hypothetical protein
MTNIFKGCCLILAAFGALRAQQVIAPTDEGVGIARGENFANYNIVDSFELGYRWRMAGGSVDTYRSDANYGDGIRLLGSNLSINSKDGHGRWFDEILLSTSGLGNDPYQNASLRIQKNGLYRYDMLWREDDYYNPGLLISGGEHRMDTVRGLQDHSLTLFPQSHFQVEMGYSRNTETGPALSTVQGFDTLSSAFPVFENVKQQWNEYRIGVLADWGGFRFIARRTWDFYKDDSGYSFTGNETSGVATDATVLQQFQRSEPNHGSNPGWFGNLYGSRKHWALNARLTYNLGNGGFAMNELTTGLDRFGAADNRQIVVNGDAQRPVVAGDFSLSLFPTSRLTIVNNTAVHDSRIDGDSYFTEFDNGTGAATTLNFKFLGVRTVANSTDLNYRFSDWFSAYAGFTDSGRQIRFLEAFSIPSAAGSAVSDLYQQESHLNAGTVGVRFRPLQPLTINLEGEVGHADHPLTPMSDRNYHTLGGRIQYRKSKLQLSTGYRELYIENAPLSLTTYSSRSRQYNAAASFALRDWLTFDASYSKLHLDTVGGLAFFAGVQSPQLQTSYDSIYISNIHAANAGLRFGIRSRADLYLGYTITKDTGDGRASAAPAGVADPIATLLDSVQTFPLTYQSPMARLSIRITPKVRWNAGWQFYGYGELFHLLGYDQNFHAHTGYTSVLWSF